MVDLSKESSLTQLRDVLRLVSPPEAEDLQRLIQGLQCVYVARALKATPEFGDEGTEQRLLRIALALEVELWLSVSSGETSDQLEQSYGVIGAVFDYYARLVPESSPSRFEYWLRASIAYSLAHEEANSIYCANRAIDLHTKSPSSYVDVTLQGVLNYLARKFHLVVTYVPKIKNKMLEQLYPAGQTQDEQEYLQRLGCLNLLEAIRRTATFARDGNEVAGKAWKDYQQRAQNLLHQSGDTYTEWIAERMGGIQERLLKRSLWSLREYIPQEYIKALVCDPDDPVIELWTAQEKITKTLLKPNAKRHQTIIAPTSAGKTHIAGMAIAKELYNQSGTAFYVVPTRALVSEVEGTLSQYLPRIGIKVSRVPGDYDVVPVLDELIERQSQVFVLTPEKLDLLWRIKDSRLANCRIFIFDEIQLVSQETRGLRLEILISKIVSKFGGKSRVLLVSAVVPHANLDAFVSWLGSDNTEGYDIKWRPTRILNGVFFRGEDYQLRGDVNYIDSFLVKNVLAPDSRRDNKADTVRLARKYQDSLGPVLVYCSRRDQAEKIARQICELEPALPIIKDEVLELETRYVEAILGSHFPLTELLSHGVAYHHAALPSPVRHGIEKLAKKGKLKVIVCTSTLLEGVNLNVKTVIISDVRAGPRKLDGAALKNLAGRAGRAIKDTEGHLVMTSPHFYQDLKRSDEDPIQSRFFQYVRALELDPRVNKDAAVIESELLAQLYMRNLKPNRIDEHMEELVASTLFARQVHPTSGEFEEAVKRTAKQARWVVENGPADQEILRVFAETGLDLEFCKKLDASVNQFLMQPNLSFRASEGPNWDSIRFVIEACNSEEMPLSTSKRRAQVLVQSSRLIQLWLEGTPLLQIASNLSDPPTDKSLTEVSRYFYSHVVDDVSWACAAFVKLLHARVSRHRGLEKIDSEWDLLPAYLRYGVSSPAALLLSVAGLEKRDLANSLANSAPTTTGTEEDWIALISWATSAAEKEPNELDSVRRQLVSKLGSFSIGLGRMEATSGPAEIGVDGAIILNGTVVGALPEKFRGLFKSLESRGYKAALISERSGSSYLRIEPSLL